MDTFKETEEEYRKLQGKDSSSFTSVVEEIVKTLPSAPQTTPAVKEVSLGPKEVTN